MAVMIITDVGESLYRVARETLVPQPTMAWVAKSVGITNQRLSNYERGPTQPPPELRRQLAKVLQVTDDYLLGIEDLQAARAKAAGLKSVQRARLTQVPVIGTALGGRGESEDWEDHVYIPSHFISGDEGSYKIGAMHLDGESMMPYLRPGDTLVFELSDKPRPGRVSAIQASATEVLCKEMKWEAGGWFGISWNSAVEPIPIEEGWRHWGILIGLYRATHGDELHRFVASGLRRLDIPLMPEE